MRNKTRLWAGMLAGGVLVFGTACDKAKDSGAVESTSASGTSTAPATEVAEKHDQAWVRAVNAIPTQKSVVIFAGDSTAFSNVAYDKKPTAWKPMADDQFTFKVAPVGGSPEKAMGDNHEKLGGGNRYTVIAFADEGGPDKANVRVLNDDFKALTDGKARIRVVHTVANAGEVSVFARGASESIFNGINFTREAGWKDIDPITGTLEIRPEGKNNVLATIPGVKMEAGKSYTYIITGTPKKFDVISVVDDVAALPGDASNAMMGDTTAMRRDTTKK